MSNFKIEVEQLRYGQVGPYKDSVYEFVIKTDLPEHDVKRFCTTFLRGGKHQVDSGKFDGNCSFPFGLESYFKFHKKDDGSYYYITCHPYTG